MRCSNAVRLPVLSAFTLLNGVKKIRLGANNELSDGSTFYYFVFPRFSFSSGHYVNTQF